jgi:hypothetical protein
MSALYTHELTLKLEIFRVVNIRSVIWDVTSCVSIEGHHRVRGIISGVGDSLLS